MFVAAFALQCTGERDALMAVYTQCGGASWPNSANWDSAASVCSWYGVTCNQAGQVIELNLAQNHLTGQLPDDIQCLPQLKGLNLDNNTLSSTFPAAVCQLQNLQYLDANYAGFFGEIPACICAMPHVMFFYLENNLMTGEIPSCVAGMTFLREMHLNCNSLSGSVPTGFTQLLYLTELRLQCNAALDCASPLSTKTNFVYICGDVNCDQCLINPNQCPAFVAVTNCGNYYRPLE